MFDSAKHDVPAATGYATTGRGLSDCCCRSSDLGESGGPRLTRNRHD